MSADVISAIAAASAPIAPPSLEPLHGGAAALPAGAASAPTGFGELVTQGLNQVNEQLMASQTDMQQLAVGNAQNLHQIMIRLEESRLSFQLAMQVRSRLLEAYQDVMKMQI